MPSDTTTGTILSTTGTDVTTVPSTVWRVVSITDGDTIDVDGPEGRWVVRLIGINAPEKGECFSDRATEAITRLIDEAPVVLVADVSDVDQYHRKLRYVETAAGTDVGAALVEGGFALARRYEPDTAKSGRYEQLQAAAQAAGRGLWAPDACGPPQTAVHIGVVVHANAAGDDNLNLNDEWVRFENQGSSPVDLEGWVVADESASHRYTFHDLVLASGAQVTLRTGCGTDSPADRYWCTAGSAVWNNGSDTVFLRDPSGNNVAVLSY